MDSSVIQHFPYLSIFVLLVLGTLGLPFPEDAILILCGLLIAQKVVEPVPVLIVASAGMILTDFFLYHVGRKYGRRVVMHRRFRKIISARRISRLQKLFKKWGVLVIFLGRHVMGLRSQIFLVAGIVKMPRPKFVAADFVSSIVTIALMVGTGYWGGSTLELIKKDVEYARYAILILIAIAAVVLLLWRLAVRKLGAADNEGE